MSLDKSKRENVDQDSEKNHRKQDGDGLERINKVIARSESDEETSPESQKRPNIIVNLFGRKSSPEENSDEDNSIPSDKTKIIDKKWLYVGGGVFGFLVFLIVASAAMMPPGSLQEKANEVKAALFNGDRPLTPRLADAIIQKTLIDLSSSLKEKDKHVAIALLAQETAKKADLSVQDQYKVAEMAVVEFLESNQKPLQESTKLLAVAMYTLSDHLGFTLEAGGELAKLSAGRLAVYAISRSNNVGTNEARALATSYFNETPGTRKDVDRLARQSIAKAISDGKSLEGARKDARNNIVHAVSVEGVDSKNAEDIANKAIFDAIKSNGATAEIASTIQQEYETAIKSGVNRDDALLLARESAGVLARKKGLSQSQSIQLVNSFTPGNHIHDQVEISQSEAGAQVIGIANKLNKNQIELLKTFSATVSKSETVELGLITANSRALDLAARLKLNDGESEKAILLAADEILKKSDFDSLTQQKLLKVVQAQTQAKKTSKSNEETQKLETLRLTSAVVDAAREEGLSATVLGKPGKVARGLGDSLNLSLQDVTLVAIQSNTSMLGRNYGDSNWAVAATVSAVENASLLLELSPKEHLTNVAEAAEYEMKLMGDTPKSQLMAVARYTRHAADGLSMTDVDKNKVLKNIIASTAENVGFPYPESEIQAAKTLAFVSNDMLSHEDRIMAVAKAVSGVTKNRNMSQPVALHKVYVATLDSARSLGLPEHEAKSLAAKARAREIGIANNLTELEISILGQKAAAIQKGRDVGLTPSETEVLGIRAAEKAIEALGLSGIESKETFKKISLIDLESYISSIDSYDSELVTLEREAESRARKTAIKQGATLQEQDEKAAAAAAIVRAREEGRSYFSQQLSAARAIALTRIKDLNVSDAEKKQIGDRAVIEALKKFDIDPGKRRSLIKEEARSSNKHAAELLAKKKTTRAGLSPMEQEMASAWAKAGVAASQRGVDQKVVTEIQERAARSVANKLGLSSSEANKALHTIGQVLSNTAGKVNSHNPYASDSGTMHDENYKSAIKDINQQVLKMSLRMDNMMSMFQANTESVRRIEQQLITDSTLKNDVKRIGNALAEEKRLRRKESVAVSDKLTILDSFKILYDKLSSRVCAQEAATGSYLSPNDCKKVYNQTPASLSVKSATSRNVNVKAISPDVLYATLPSTKGIAEARIYGELPTTVASSIDQRFSARSADVVSENACTDASKKWRYKTISQRSARVENVKTKQTHTLSFGSTLSVLGDVLHFQAVRKPKFILFSNGVICR